MGIFRIAAAILSAFCAVNATHAAAEPRRIPIGISVPLSGDAALYGQDIRNALVFANERLADGRYALIVEDDRCSEKAAVSVAQKFFSLDKVRHVLGFGCSGALLAAAPVYERAKIVVIASATGAPAISDAGEYIFRTIPSLNVAAEKLQHHAAARHGSIGIISEQTAYCQGLKDAFIRYNAGSALKISTEEYLSDSLDHRSLLLKLKQVGSAALFLNPQTEAGLVRLARQVRELGWQVPLYAAYYPGSPTYLNEFGSAGDGIIYADLPFPSQYLTTGGAKLYDEYVRRYGDPKSGDYNIILSFLAFQALDDALRAGGDVREYLSGHRFKGVVDDFGFDRNGDITSDTVTFVLKVIRDGKPAPLER